MNDRRKDDDGLSKWIEKKDIRDNVRKDDDGAQSNVQPRAPRETGQDKPPPSSDD